MIVLLRAQVGDNRVGTGGAQLIACLAAGVACTGKANHHHACGDSGGHADRRILHHDAGTRFDTQFSSCVQEQIGRRLALHRSPKTGWVQKNGSARCFRG